MAISVYHLAQTAAWQGKHDSDGEDVWEAAESLTVAISGFHLKPEGGLCTQSCFLSFIDIWTSLGVSVCLYAGIGLLIAKVMLRMVKLQTHAVHYFSVGGNEQRREGSILLLRQNTTVCNGHFIWQQSFLSWLVRRATHSTVAGVGSAGWGTREARERSSHCFGFPSSNIAQGTCTKTSKRDLSS